MDTEIFAAKKELTPEQKVNSVGRYIYKNTESAFKAEKWSQHYEVFFELLYEIPPEIVEKYHLEGEYTDLHSMIISTDLTNQSGKLRCNVIQQDEDERTLGCKTFNFDKFQDNKELCEAVLAYMRDRVIRNYQDYDFVF